jgi:chemotaxis protein MotA
MDWLTLFGILLAAVAILLGNHLEGGHMQALLNFPAMLIVVGGSTGAVMVQTPFPTMRRALRIAVWVALPPAIDLRGGIDRLLAWSTTSRKEGLLGLEGIAEVETDAFAQKGLRLLVDGAEPQTIRDVLELDLDQKEARDLGAAKVFESMGGYSPTIGIIGAVLGLIHVMGNLADPSSLGGGIAVAFVATIYGVGVANLLLLPIANKLKQIVHLRSRYCALIIDGLVAISEGENPRSIELKLSGYLER